MERMPMENTQQIPQNQQFQTEQIDALPVASFKGNNDLDKIFSIPEEATSNPKLKREIMEIGLIIFLFILVSLPFVSEILRNQLGDSENMILGARASLFAVLYYIIKNTYLSEV